MDICLLTDLGSAKRRFSISADKYRVNLKCYNPDDLIIKTSKGTVSFLDKKLMPVTFSGLINWMLGPVTMEFDLACQILGIPFFNSVESINNAKNKMVSSMLFHRRQIPHPETIFSNNNSHITRAPISYPFVYKPLQGMHGKGAHLINNHNEFSKVQGEMENSIYLQRFVENFGWDLRLITVGGNVLGAIKKVAKSGEWRTHTYHGGKVESFDPSPEVCKLAVNMAQAVGLTVAGLDIAYSKDKEYVALEANGCPGFKVFEKYTDLSISDAVLSHMIRLVKGNEK